MQPIWLHALLLYCRGGGRTTASGLYLAADLTAAGVGSCHGHPACGAQAGHCLQPLTSRCSGFAPEAALC